MKRDILKEKLDVLNFMMLKKHPTGLRMNQKNDAVYDK